MRLSVTATYEIAAAHHLPYHAGKCHRLHGHNYRVEVTVYGVPKGETWHMEGDRRVHDSDEGMIMDFGDLDDAVKAVLARLDHHTLNDVAPGLENPTAEHLAVWLLAQLPLAHRVVVWETGRHCATAEREVFS